MCLRQLQNTVPGRGDPSTRESLPWRFWQEEETDTYYDGPRKLYSDRNTIRAAVITTLSGIVDNCCQEEALNVV